MKVIGLTGGIASGKSTVAAFFRDLGAAIIDADQIVHDLYDTEPLLAAQLSRIFGAGILDASQKIDRKALGNIVFKDEAQRKKLETLIHPLVRKKIQEEIDKARAAGYRLCLVDAALLVESGLHKLYEGLIVVKTSPALQIERLMKRSALSRQDCEKRLVCQASLEEKLGLADWVILNEGSLDDTRRQVKTLYRSLV